MKPIEPQTHNDRFEQEATISSQEEIQSVILGLSTDAVVESKKNQPPLHWGAGPDGEDTALKGEDNPQVQESMALIIKAFDQRVCIDNRACSLEKIFTFRRSHGFILEAIVRTADGDLVEVPFMVEREYTPQMIANRVAQCRISASVRAAMRGGLRVNNEFFNLFSFEIETTDGGNQTTLLIHSNGKYYRIELPLREKFSRQEIVTTIAIALLHPEQSKT